MIMAQIQRAKCKSDGEGRKAASNKERSKAVDAESSASVYSVRTQWPAPVEECAPYPAPRSCAPPCPSDVHPFGVPCVVLVARR